MEQVLDEGSQEPIYNKLVVSRPIMPMGRDIGYLPGTMEEKMAPWLAPVQDNLKFLMGNDKVALEMYAERGIIEIEALTYIRGRSIANAFIIIDEAQNLSVHELKTIITRVGENTKICFCGDSRQSDLQKDREKNGIIDFLSILRKMESFDIIEFGVDDIVRSGLVKEYIIAKMESGF